MRKSKLKMLIIICLCAKYFIFYSTEFSKIIAFQEYLSEQ